MWYEPIQPEMNNDAFSICNIYKRVPKVKEHKSSRHIDVFINNIPLVRVTTHVKIEEAVPGPPEAKRRKISPGEGEKLSVTKENNQEVIASRNNFDSLPDEVILNIFQRLPQNQLGNVALVCRRFKQIVDDASLWEIIDASHRVINPDVWKGIMGRPVKILRLAESRLNSPEISSEIRDTCPDDLCRLIHLDLTGTDISEDTLTVILNKCRNLKRLSLARVLVTDEVIVALSTIKDLEALKLAWTRGITAKGMYIILTNFPKLKELNLAWTRLSREIIHCLCEHIPSSLEKFSIAGCWHFGNENFTQIVKKFPYIRELDVSFCKSLTLDIVPILHTLKELRILDIRLSQIPHAPLLALKGIKDGVCLHLHSFRARFLVL